MLDFVQYHQALEIAKRQHGIRKTRNRGRILQIESRDLAPVFGSDGSRQCRLANLPGAEQADDRKSLEQALNRPKMQTAIYHRPDGTLKYLFFEPDFPGAVNLITPARLPRRFPDNRREAGSDRRESDRAAEDAPRGA